VDGRPTENEQVCLVVYSVSEPRLFYHLSRRLDVCPGCVEIKLKQDAKRGDAATLLCLELAVASTDGDGSDRGEGDVDVGREIPVSKVGVQ
jgi:hypothetical protein